jgi:hypothetical protein
MTSQHALVDDHFLFMFDMWILAALSIHHVNIAKKISESIFYGFHQYNDIPLSTEFWKHEKVIIGPSRLLLLKAGHVWSPPEI